MPPSPVTFRSQPLMECDTWLAFATGCVVATLFAWWIADVRAQSARENTVHVCVAADGILRFHAASSSCQPGEKSMQLLPQIDNQQRNVPDGTQLTSLRGKLADLERQAAALERWTLPGGVARTVRAPFEVADRNGKVVFSVTNHDVYGTSVRGAGRSSFELHASELGGFLRTRSTSRAPDVTAGEIGAGLFGVDVNDAGRGIEFGTENGGETYRLKIIGKDGLVAGIGQSSLGSGLAFVGDRGTSQGRMYVSRNKGMVTISDRIGQALSVLTEGANGGGLLTINNSAGDPMVEAGVADKGYGVVRAGPEAFKPGYGVLGLPASSIAGKAK